jgi:hypothetical protein
MKTFSVIVLGLSGSGKTVYLASMYKKLVVPGKKIGFSLDIQDETQRNRLIKTYNQAANVGKPWPPGTTYGEVSEWNFICRVQTPVELENFTACHFTYLDYAGGRIDNTTEDSDPDFKSKLENADALLGLLDGEKVLGLMRGGENELDLELEYLPYIIPYMQIGKKNPVHFVISKWDIIEDEFTLGQVREKLLQIYSFKQLVENRLNARSNVRLIPVSSLGKGFAELQPDGTMKKVQGATPKPYQVEMPIACVIPDIIRLKLKQMEAEVQENESFSEVQANLSFWEKIRRNFVNFIQVVQDNLPSNYRLAPDVIKTIIEVVDRAPREQELAAAQRNEELRKMQAEKIKAIKDEQSALEYAISCFLYVESTLDFRFPESRLSLPYYDED